MFVKSLFAPVETAIFIFVLVAVIGKLPYSSEKIVLFLMQPLL